MSNAKTAHWISTLLLAALIGVAGPSLARGEAPVPAAAVATTKVPASHSPGIRAISDMNDVLAEVAPLRRRFGAEAVLVVFDLDNTLLAGEALVGSDAWYTWQEALATKGARKHAFCPAIQYEADNLTEEDVTLLREKPAEAEIERYKVKAPELLEVQGVLYQVGHMRRTQPDVDDVVRRVQRAGHPAMVLTSRGPQVRGPTHRELQRNGLSFTCSAPGCCPLAPCVFRWTQHDLAQFNAQELACFGSSVRFAHVDMLYEAGVYMTSGGHKGAALRALLARLRTRVSAIVFVDDTWKHLDRMRSAFALTGVEVHNLYYTREHDRVRTFVADGADLQWDETKAVVDALLGTARYDCARQELRRWQRPDCCPTVR